MTAPQRVLLTAVDDRDAELVLESIPGMRMEFSIASNSDLSPSGDTGLQRAVFGARGVAIIRDQLDAWLAEHAPELAKPLTRAGNAPGS